MRAVLTDALATRWLRLAVFLAAASAGTSVCAGPHVEFDFARTVACRNVTPPERAVLFPNERIVKVTLNVSVRFHGVPPQDVEELDIEISGATAGWQVFRFSPTTHLASDIAKAIETTTTTKDAKSLDATLGGALPVPYAELVAHVAPSINAGTSRSTTATETVSRLPPRRAVIVSGTSSEGRGVFFKIKPSTQTSLEGVHALTVSFIVPADWDGGTVRVACTAHGQRRILWFKDPATLGRAGGEVTLRLVGDGPVDVAKPQADDAKTQAVGPGESQMTNDK